MSTSAVFDASAVIALIKEEPGAEVVERHIGHAAISAVNLQEVIKELFVQGLDAQTIRELLHELRLDVRAHDEVAAYAAASLHTQTREYGRGLGDRSCMALGITLNVPVLTADREWKKVKAKGLSIVHLR